MAETYVQSYRNVKGLVVVFFRFACFSLTSTPWCAAETMSGEKAELFPLIPDVHDVQKPAAWWTPPSSCVAVEKAEFQSRWSSATVPQCQS